MNQNDPLRARGELAFRRGSTALVIVTLLAGAVNYLYTTGMGALLVPTDFVVFVAAQALLFMIGTAVSAGVPWFLARRLADTSDLGQRNAAVSFSIVVNTCLAVLASLTVVAVVARLGDTTEVAAAVLAAAAVCFGSTTVGLLMGSGRILTLSALRLGEVAIRAVFGVVAVLLGFGAAGAIGATAVGSLFFVLPLIPAMREYRPSVDGLARWGWWRALGGHVSVQLALAIFASVDIIVVTMLQLSAGEEAGYQLAMTIGRIPFFYALALGVAAFSNLVHRSELREDRDVLSRYLVVALPAAVIAATVPDVLVVRIFPDLADTVTELLPLAAMTGLLLGGCALLAVRFQAAERLRSISLLLLMLAALIFPAAAFANERAGAEGVAVAVLTIVAAALLGSVLVGRLVGLEVRFGRLRLPPWLLLTVLLIPVSAVVPWLLITGALAALVTIRLARDLVGRTVS